MHVNLARKRSILSRKRTHEKERKGKKREEEKKEWMEIASLVDSRSIRTASRIYRETFSKFPLQPHGLSNERSRKRGKLRLRGRLRGRPRRRAIDFGGEGWGGRAGFQFKVGRACRDFNVQNAYAKLFAPLW